MSRLPQQIRRPQRERERGAHPKPPTTKRFAAARAHEADCERGDEQQHDVLVLECEPDDKPDKKPQALVATSARLPWPIRSLTLPMYLRPSAAAGVTIVAVAVSSSENVAVSVNVAPDPNSMPA